MTSPFSASPFPGPSYAGPNYAGLSGLDQRARDIFRRIVENYLETGEPVGSRTLSMSGISLSPASIRNTMQDLTLAGLLASPHTSSGRIPTHAGLRLFVDGLLEIGDVGEEERREIDARLAARSGRGGGQPFPGELPGNRCQARWAGLSPLRDALGKPLPPLSCYSGFLSTIL